MRVLIVEDHPADVELIRTILKECRWDMQDCDTIEDAFRLKESFKPEVILLDLALKDSSRQETLEAIGRLSDHAIVVLTGDCDAATISSAFKNGADDCLSKSCFNDRRAFIQTIRGAWDHFSRRKGFTQGQQVGIGSQISQAEKELLMHVPTMRESVTRLEDAVWFAKDSIVGTLKVVSTKVDDMSSQAKYRMWMTIIILIVNMIVTVIGALTHTEIKPVGMPQIEEHR